MFSSNPFPDLPSSPSNDFLPPNLFFDHEKDCAFLYYHQTTAADTFISGDCLTQPDYNNLAPPPLIINNNNIIKQDFVRPQLQFSQGHDDDLLDSVISCCKKKTESSKKDGHSKIYTARGPRDRRVRLSIDISRKFFCLQDMLGFDKASKTLDWLLDKSKNAIKELVEETNHCSSASCVTDQSKVDFLEAIKGGLDEDNGQKKKPVVKCVHVKRKKMTRRNKTEFQVNLARDQSRAMARARARERTIGKMQIKSLDDELKTLFPDDFDCTQNFERNTGENHRAVLIPGDL